MTEATIFTDGSANNIRGTGGWCAIIRTESSLIEISGWEDSTTSNRMELLAAIKGLKQFKLPTKIVLVSDSTYMIKSLKNKWYERWFEEEEKVVRPNLDLWRILVSLIQFHDITLVKVKGHSGVYWNERADHLAKIARVEKHEKFERSDTFDESRPCEFELYDKKCTLPFGHVSPCLFTNKIWKWEI